MLFLEFVFIYLLFIVLVFGNETGNQRINIEFKNQNEAPTSIKSTNSFHEDQSSNLKIKDRLIIKREATGPGIFKASLDTGLLPVGINAQLGPQINLNLNQYTKPNSKEQNGNPGTISVVSYPAKIFAINPKDVDKKLSDIMTDISLNNISTNNNSNDASKLNDNSKNDQNLKSAAAVSTSIVNKTLVNSTNKLHDVIDSSTPRVDNEKSLNVSKDVENHTTLLSTNSSNKTAPTVVNQKDDYFWRNDSQSQITENPLPNNSTFSKETNSENKIIPLLIILGATEESSGMAFLNKTGGLKGSDTVGLNISYTYDRNGNNNNILETTKKDDDCCLNKTEHSLHESQPSYLKIEDKKRTQYDCNKTKPKNEETQYVPTENIKPGSQSLNSFQNEKTENTLESNVMDSNRNNIGLLFNRNDGKIISDNKDAKEYRYPTYLGYRYLKPLPETEVPYSNNLKWIYNDDATSINRANGNQRPVFIYRNADTYQYKKVQNVPVWTYQYVSDRNGNNLRPLTYELNKYPTPQLQNTIAYQYGKPERLLENNDRPVNVYDFPRVFDVNRISSIVNHRTIKPELRHHVKIIDKNEYPYLKYYKPTYAYNENRNNMNQKSTNMRSIIEYSLKNQNSNTQQYEPELVQSQRVGDANEREIYKEIINDASMLSRNNVYYYTNNRPRYGTLNVNNRNSIKPQRIICCCNQHPVITCNGFYINQNVPRAYPIYVYNPYAYGNVPY